MSSTFLWCASFSCVLLAKLYFFFIILSYWGKNDHCRPFPGQSVYNSERCCYFTKHFLESISWKWVQMKSCQSSLTDVCFLELISIFRKIKCQKKKSFILISILHLSPNSHQAMLNLIFYSTCSFSCFKMHPLNLHSTGIYLAVVLFRIKWFLWAVLIFCALHWWDPAREMQELSQKMPSLFEIKYKLSSHIRDKMYW